MAYLGNKQVSFSAEIAGLVNIDREYNPESENPQSGKAVAEAAGQVFNFTANALKSKKKSSVIAIHDISPIEHTIKTIVGSKNLFPNVATNREYTNGTTVTVNADGSITCDFKSGDTISFKTTIELPAGTYTISSGVNAVPYIYAKFYGLGGFIGEINTKTDDARKTITVNETCSVIVGLYGTIANNGISTLYPQLEEGSAATEYTPNLENMGEVTVSRYGKNLIDVSNWNKEYTNGSYVKYDDETGGLKMKKVAEDIFATSHFSASVVLPAGTYTFSNKTINSIQSTPYFTISGKYLSNDEKAFNAKYNSGTFTLEEPAQVTLNIYASTSVTTENEIATFPQLEVGDVDTDFEKYIKVKTSTPMADGTANGITSVYPNTTILSNKKGITIDTEYNRDINKAFEEIVNAVMSLGGEI